MRLIISSLFILIAFNIKAQLTIILDNLPETTPGNAELFIAGNFNQWNPSNNQFKLLKNTDDKYSITFSPSAGILEFKFTRGSWSTVEGSSNGTFVPNRTHQYNGQPTTLNLNIAGWEGLSSNPSTASPQVSILNDSFYITALNRYRKIWLYLPKDYNTSSKKYPVIYMHDGQNLFDRTTSFSGEWKVDETLDSLYDKGDYSCIVVGIDNGGSKRIDEYSPWINAEYGGGEGSEYIDFIVAELKPFIDQNYRTKSDPENTAMIGSSMGGLITFYGGIKYQNVFGLLGPLSSSYWFSISAYDFAEAYDFTDASQKIYMIAGGKEGGNQVGDMYFMRKTLYESNFDPSLIEAIDHPNEGHNETYWAKEFPNVYKWLFNKGLNLTTEQKSNYNFILVDDSLCMIGDYNLEDKMSIIDMNGRKIMERTLNANNTCLELKNMRLSTYVVSILNDGNVKFSKKILLGK